MPRRRTSASLLRRQLGARPARNLPSFTAANADHAEQVHHRLIHLSRQDGLVADSQAEANDRVRSLPPSQLRILNPISPRNYGIANISDGVGSHDPVHRTRNDLGAAHKPPPPLV